MSTVMLSLLEPDVSKNLQGIEVGVTSFNIITTQRLFDSYSHNFEFCGCEGQKGMLPPRDTTMIPLNRKLRLPPSHFRFLMPLNQQAKKGITTLVGLTDPNHEGEIG